MQRLLATFLVVALAAACSSGDGGGGGSGGTTGACSSLPLCFDVCVCATGDPDQCALSCQQNGCGAPTCGDCQGCEAICLCVSGGNQLGCQQACGGGTSGSGGSGAVSGSGGTAAVGGSGGTGPTCDDGSGWDLAWQAFECEVVDLVNQRRAQGATCDGTPYPAVPPLAAHPLLKQSARGHAKDMGDNNFFSHTNLQGQSSADRIIATGYSGSPVGENIAAGQDTPAAVVQGWMESPGHCKNIMNGAYDNLGVGYYFAPSSQYEHYWVQNFGG